MKTEWLKWVVFIFLAFVWGSSFILMKKSLDYFSYYEVGALRILISGIIFLPFVLKRIKGIKRKEWVFLVLVGLVGNTVPAFLFTKAQTGIDSALAGILNSLTPLFTLLIGLSFFQLKTRWFNIIGVFLALIGTTALLMINGGHNFEYNITYGIYVVIAVNCYAFNLNIVKYKLSRLDPLTITSVAFVIMLIPLSIFILTATSFTTTITCNKEAINGLLYVGLLAVFGSALALLLFNWLIKVSGVMLTASITYLIPVVAIFWGLSDKESFGIFDLLSVAIILSGIVLVNIKSKSTNKAPKINK
jgi:drug/metabolite transporter (DMT)-like permease